MTASYCEWQMRVTLPPDFPKYPHSVIMLHLYRNQKKRTVVHSCAASSFFTSLSVARSLCPLKRVVLSLRGSIKCPRIATMLRSNKRATIVSRFALRSRSCLRAERCSTNCSSLLHRLSPVPNRSVNRKLVPKHTSRKCVLTKRRFTSRGRVRRASPHFPPVRVLSLAEKPGATVIEAHQSRHMFLGLVRSLAGRINKRQYRSDADPKRAHGYR